MFVLSTAEKIKELRTHLGLSMQAFADRLGVSKPSISYWESGKKEPTFDNLEAIENLAISSGVKIDIIPKLPGEKTYKECNNCHYNLVEVSFSYCPMCAEPFKEIDMEVGASILLNYYQIDKLINNAEEAALYPFIDLNRIRKGKASEPVTNKEEMKAIQYSEKADVIRYLKDIKEKVPLVLTYISGMEKEIIELLYCSHDNLKKSYSIVSKKTNIDYDFIKRTDEKVKKLVCSYLVH